MLLINNIASKVIYGLIILFAVADCNTPEVVYPEHLNQLRKNLVQYYLNTPIDKKKVNLLLENLKNDGSWPDIEYTNQRRGGWPIKEHLANVQILTIAYKTERSEYYRKSSVSKKIHLALIFWLKHDFLSANWWDQHIGVSKLLVSDPTQKLTMLALKIGGIYTGDYTEVSGNGTKLSIPLPQNGDAGKTLAVTLNHYCPIKI